MINCKNFIDSHWEEATLQPLNKGYNLTAIVTMKNNFWVSFKISIKLVGVK